MLAQQSLAQYLSGDMEKMDRTVWQAVERETAARRGRVTVIGIPCIRTDLKPLKEES